MESSFLASRADASSFATTSDFEAGACAQAIFGKHTNAKPTTANTHSAQRVMATPSPGLVSCQKVIERFLPLSGGRRQCAPHFRGLSDEESLFVVGPRSASPSWAEVPQHA